MQQNNLNRYFLKSLMAIGLIATNLYAETNTDNTFLKNSWTSLGYSNAKDVMMGGATTATGKGPSALFTNPAGLSTNYTFGIYATASQIDHLNATGSTNDEESLSTTQEVLPADNTAVGIFYDSFVVEVKPDKHIAVGLAYGLETNYGLFSIGANVVKDQTTEENYKEFGTGDYYTGGFQYQKSFVGIENLYAFYFGVSKKGQGVSQYEDQVVYKLSPIVQKIGFGFETNWGSSSLLLTVDQSTQSWLHFDDTLNIMAIGLKWMMFDGFSMAIAHSDLTYDTAVPSLDSGTTNSVGLELGLWKLNIALAAMQKEILNDTGDVYIQENSLHADVSFAF